MIKEAQPEVVENLFAAIGETVINWTILEGAIGNLIALTYQSADGKHPAKRGTIPYGLTDKLYFLNRCIRNLTSLKPFAEEGVTLIERIRNIKDTREMLVHGVVSDYSETDQKLLFVRIDLNKEKTMQVVKESHYTIEKILDDSGEALSIGSDALILAARILKEFVPEYKEKGLLQLLSR